MSKFYILHSAEALRERIHLTLARDPYVGKRAVRFELIDRDVLLTGSVRTYFQKQMAQESLRGIEGLGRIDNRLEVIPSIAPIGV
jgi:osmotically-inducible protein OsmY